MSEKDNFVFLCKGILTVVAKLKTLERELILIIVISKYFNK